MATTLKNLSSAEPRKLEAYSRYRIALVVSDWNSEITLALRDGALDFLTHCGVPVGHIRIISVPGAFELPLAAKWMATQKEIDAVITLGCVIQGETRHFDFICDACAHGITEVGLSTGKPVIFGVLTTQDLDQAIARAGGKHGNKGTEAAATALQMLELKERL